MAEPIKVRYSPYVREDDVMEAFEDVGARLILIERVLAAVVEDVNEITDALFTSVTPDNGEPDDVAAAAARDAAEEANEGG